MIAYVFVALCTIIVGIHLVGVLLEIWGIKS